MGVEVYMMLKQLAGLPQKNLIAGAITFVIALVAITPLCGFLFQCGCDWPWLGLDAHCNYYKPQAEHKCPWCASMFVGILSTGLAVVSGVVVALFMPTLGFKSTIVVRTLQGLVVFVVLALLTANIAAKWQLYPLGTGSTEERSR
ncbi:MAG: hypothetical protein methR_P3107 [Methyloprofundus sp.]|nr:MAG: hypothetical protein methR_P3107 [Methyloprofundus sp.]